MQCATVQRIDKSDSAERTKAEGETKNAKGKVVAPTDATSIMKRPSAACAPAIKRPACAPPHVQKRRGSPPSGEQPTSYTKPARVEWDHKRDCAKTKNTFCSLWYDRCKRLLNKTWGVSDADKKIELKRVFSMASKVYDDRMK